MKHVNLLFAWLLAWNICNAQNYSFISFTNSQGLPQSQVQCVTQDSEGYLWIGTLGGLARFNGKKFTNFSVNEGLLSNSISALAFIDGLLIIGHEGGISIREGNKIKTYSFLRSDRDSRTTDIIKFGDQLILSTYQGEVYSFNKKSGLQKIESKELESCKGIYDLEIINNKLTLATNSGILYTSDLPNFRRLRNLEGLDISGLSKRSDGKIWVTTYESGSILFNNDFKPLDTVSHVSDFFGVERAFIDSRDQLWLTSNTGMLRIKKDKSQVFMDANNGLPGFSMRCVYEDREGNIWCGSDGKGLLRFSGERILSYRLSNGLPSDQILSLHKKSDGTFYYGCYEEGLYESQKNGEFKRIPIDRIRIWDMATDPYGNLWVGTELGLAVYKKNGEIAYHFLGDRSQRVTTVERIRNTIYLGGAGSLGKVTKNQFYEIPLTESERKKLGHVKSIVAYKGKILCATSKGVFDITDQHPKTFMNFRKGTISMTVDNANHLWVGTENGLYLLSNNRFTLHQISDSPGSYSINFIEPIGSKCFIGTNNGLYVVDALSLTVEKHYGLNDGLVNLECNSNSSLFDGKYLWFGTAEGLIRFDVDYEDKSKQLAPLLNIASILVNYNSVDYKRYATEMKPNGIPAGIKLPFSMNNITIDLDGISFSDPEAVHYQFWLEGQDEIWSKPSGNATITLSNISDGDHLLHIRAIDKNRNTSETLLFPITITPPFWRTWWFYSAIAALVILGIRFFFRWRIKQERERNYKKNLEYKSRLLALEQQSLNASMNRHFIFNSLNSIQYFINTQDRISANKYLTNFAKLIRKNLDSAVEAENMVTLQQEIERLELYLSLEAMRFKDRFTYTINDNGIDTEAIVVPGMLLQPFVENSIIHGILPNEAIVGHIEVTVQKTEDYLQITIDDNGIGIDFSLQQKHMFSGDHKSQGMEITSKRIDIIRELSKKDFELEGPFQLYNPDKSIKGTRVSLKIPLENLDL